MLNAIRIENFKLFRDLELPLHPLTVLTGFNSSGKSTVIQAFLLSDLACRSSTVSLNGPYGLALGEAFDVLNLGAPDAEIRFTLTGDGEDVSIRLPVSEDRAVSLSAHDPSETGDLQSFDIGIGAYLSAERLGPRDLLEVPSALEGSSYLGERGQFTAHVLAQRARVRVIPELLHPKSAESESLVAVTLASQVEAWLSDVVRPVRVQATWLPSTSAAMIRFREVPSLSDASTESFDGELPADWMRPSNVGFGL
jgi:predicted ATPase